MKVSQPNVHVDQLLRQTRVHHVQLSMMADQKAGLLLTVCAIIIPLTARFLQNDEFYYTAISLICFCILTMFLAIYTAMPSIGRTHKIDTSSPSFNCLFFADFADLDYDEYTGIIEQVINDPTEVYERQFREVYLLGKYLARHKYRFLRYAYISFISGILVSCIVFTLTRF